MKKQTHLRIQHSISESKDIPQTNELIVVSPEHTPSRSTILYLHGHQIGVRQGAWEGLRLLSSLVDLGYTIIMPSVLGYGKTTGKPDYSGPETISRLYETCIPFLKSPVHIMGASRGGTLAILFAEKYPELYRSLISIAGTYNLAQQYSETHDEHLKQNLKEETDLSSEAFQVRSPQYNFSHIDVPVCLIHGSDDGQIPVHQAINFNQILKESDKDVVLHIVEKGGHKLFGEKLVADVIVPFIEYNDDKKKAA